MTWNPKRGEEDFLNGLFNKQPIIPTEEALPKARLREKKHMLCLCGHLHTDHNKPHGDCGCKDFEMELCQTISVRAEVRRKEVVGSDAKGSIDSVLAGMRKQLLNAGAVPTSVELSVSAKANGAYYYFLAEAIRPMHHDWERVSKCPTKVNRKQEKEDELKAFFDDYQLEHGS